MKRILILISFLIGGSVIAQSMNSYQPLQPWRWNAFKRNSAVDLSAPDPDFRALSDASITPTIGTAGTFSRASAALRPSSKNALASAGSGSAQAPAFAQGIGAATHTVGGLYITAPATNYLLRASEFDNAAWVKNGTGSVAADSTTDPAGGSTADTITGGAANDGVQQDTGEAAANMYGACMVWLKADTGSRTVTLIIKDEAGSPASTEATLTVTTSWQLFHVDKGFAGGATGTVVCEIKVNDTTGYNIYAYGAGFINEQNTANGLNFDPSMLPTIITTNATVTKAADRLEYNGNELKCSSTKKTLLFWAYGIEWSAGQQNADFNMFVCEGSAFARYLRLYNSGDTIIVTYHDSAAAGISTGDAIPENRWNQFIVAIDGTTGDNEVYLNGSSIHTNSATFSAFALTGIAPAVDFLPSSGANRLSYHTVFGRTEFWCNYRINDDQALELYDEQKADYGL